jgi:hypothetical protein
LAAYRTGAIGYDASWPQCRSNLPSAATNGSTYGFAILGANHTIAYTANECVAAQYSAAVSRGQSVAFYTDVHSPSGASASQGATGPKGTCAPSDTLCTSYNYGYNGAANAFQTASKIAGPAAAASAVWWLDVETGKPWSTSTSANAMVIQGAIDYFQANGSVVGAYSVLWMWNKIAGTYYRPGIPAWISGARSLGSAPSFCNLPSFTGGPIVLVQQPGGKLDQDYAC